MSCGLSSVHNVPHTSTADRWCLPMTASKGNLLRFFLCVSVRFSYESKSKPSEDTATGNFLLKSKICSDDSVWSPPSKLGNQTQNHICATQVEWCWPLPMGLLWKNSIAQVTSRVSDQNSISLQWFIVEIYHSRQKPSIYKSVQMHWYFYNQHLGLNLQDIITKRDRRRLLWLTVVVRNPHPVLYPWQREHHHCWHCWPGLHCCPGVSDPPHLHTG